MSLVALIEKSAEALDFRMGVMGARCLLRSHVFAQPALTSDPESALIFDGLKGCSKKQTL